MEFWYTLYTKPNAEYQVATSLQKRGIQAYLSEIEPPKTGQEQTKPFFPCYLFIEIDFETVGLSQVQWTPGLRRVVAFDDRPVPLSDEVIDLIRHRLEEIKTAESWPAHTFQIGEPVRVADGPLQGLLAIFEGPSAPTQRVQVLLNFLGQVSRAHIPISNLEKAPSEAQTRPPKRPRRTRGHGRRIKNLNSLVSQASPR